MDEPLHLGCSLKATHHNWDELQKAQDRASAASLRFAACCAGVEVPRWEENAQLLRPIFGNKAGQARLVREGWLAGWLGGVGCVGGGGWGVWGVWWVWWVGGWWGVLCREGIAF